MMTGRFVIAGLVCVLTAGAGCKRVEAPGGSETGDTSNVTQFLADANTKLLKVLNEANEAGWVLGTYITTDTQAISARADEGALRSGTPRNASLRGCSP